MKYFKFILVNVLDDDDDDDFVCIHEEMTSFRVNKVCFWNSSIQASGRNFEYVGGRH